ncbi:Carboxypeptidase Y like A, partial [Dissostichus eleginoides]
GAPLGPVAPTSPEPLQEGCSINDTSRGAVLRCLVAHEYSMRQRVGKCAAWNIWS